MRNSIKDKLPKLTKIIVAQRVSSVKDCTNIMILENGCIKAYGTHDELRKTSKFYQTLIEHQLGQLGTLGD